LHDQFMLLGAVRSPLGGHVEIQWRLQVEASDSTDGWQTLGRGSRMATAAV
jgi:hypothetical protein